MNIPEGVDLRDYIRIVGELEAQEIYSAGAWREPLLKKADGDDDLTGCINNFEEVLVIQHLHR